MINIYTKIKFVFVYKEPEVPHICVMFEPNLFHIENSYIVSVESRKIDIYVKDLGGLQYAFSTFLQLCSLFLAKNIPPLKVSQKKLDLSCFEIS